MTDGPTHIFDHVDRRLARLVHALSKPRIESILRMYGEALQDIENEAYSLIMERLLDTSVGAQLDQWGDLVGEDRDGLNDDRYRAFIDARLLINNSDGQIDTITAVLASLGEATGPVWYHPAYPAGYYISFPTETEFTAYDQDKLIERLRDATPAGVGLLYIVVTPRIAFSFEGDPEGAGFGEGEFGGTMGGTIDA